MLGAGLKFTEGNVSSLTGTDEESTLLQVSMPIQWGSSGGPVLSHAGRVLGVIEASIEEDDDGHPMQLANFARSATVAQMLLPAQLDLPVQAAARNRDAAIARAMKSVCEVRTE